ncbi:MAG: hypothetical protein ACD_47C00009G0002 [uncultured bacterium]|uniref:Uncharacterized protein n=1 Tax=Candidatus Wallbacteria bacterium GWC2_49_35 TaxID=1817813 RepID=A0A1F7WKF7_9BACT|nr:MAG: hypothetical protein ACD_47C00009G0002 [uncultured bacterium]OGM03314.1 MAG: hypothetical protein A2008_07295 [Candidatus Wallbacteria bacterium GWC2_49_35]HBC74094.1 hypothetical protein [Candidatus Wallbacteria bacterium]
MKTIKTEFKIAVYVFISIFFAAGLALSAEAAGKTAADKSAKKIEKAASEEDITPDESDSSKDVPGGPEKKEGFSFSYNAESKIDKMSRERMKEKNFLEKISNEFFEIYADEDDFTVLASFPFGKENSAYTLKFKDEYQLVVTFTHKTDKSKKPVRYEISFPEPTKKEAFDFTVRDRLELNVPIDFFYAERKNFR